MLAFPMVGRFLAWKDGNDTQVRIGTNAIALYGVNIFLHETLIVSFQELGICTLNTVDSRQQPWDWKSIGFRFGLILLQN
jgi:hypothetical protein